MSVPIIYPYKLGSRSARALAAALGTKRVKPDGKYKYKQNHAIINWGMAKTPNWMVPGLPRDYWFNTPEAVNVAGNKLKAFEAMKEAGVSIPEFTTDKEVASEWCGEGCVVVNRARLRGSGGAGISLATGAGELGEVPLYVKYVKKKREYRVHVFDGKVIDVQQKKKRNGIEDADYQIRNHENGWVFCREGVVPPDQVLSSSVAACAALGLDFGAVDVIWNDHYQQEYVLEVNTAPGLEGTTLDKYVEAIMEACNNHGD